MTSASHSLPRRVGKPRTYICSLRDGEGHRSPEARWPKLLSWVRLTSDPAFTLNYFMSTSNKVGQAILSPVIGRAGDPGGVATIHRNVLSVHIGAIGVIGGSLNTIDPIVLQRSLLPNSHLAFCQQASAPKQSPDRHARHTHPRPSAPCPPRSSAPAPPSVQLHQPRPLLHLPDRQLPALQQYLHLRVSKSRFGTDHSVRPLHSRHRDRRNPATQIRPPPAYPPPARPLQSHPPPARSSPAAPATT